MVMDGGGGGFMLPGSSYGVTEEHEMSLVDRGGEGYLVQETEKEVVVETDKAVEETENIVEETEEVVEETQEEPEEVVEEAAEEEEVEEAEEEGGDDE